MGFVLANYHPQIKQTTDNDSYFRRRIVVGGVQCPNKPVVKIAITVGLTNEAAGGTVAIFTAGSYSEPMVIYSNFHRRL